MKTAHDMAREREQVSAGFSGNGTAGSSIKQRCIEMALEESNALPDKKPTNSPAFVWWDLENFKTALRAFITFWLATAVWITFNPPGGFMFVTLCTALIPLVSYTPVTPKLLIILFSLGFLFAVPAYIFLLPQMTHWVELSLFLFTYAFVGFLVFQGPVSIFFLLGLFTLGIQNEMSYNVNIIFLVIAMFYLVCTLLIISIHFPFTSKPEQIYPGIARRFFSNCAELLRRRKSAKGLSPTAARSNTDKGARLLAKLNNWGTRIDANLFPTASPESLVAFYQSCELLQAQLQELAIQDQVLSDNRLIMTLGGRVHSSPMADLCDMLSHGSCPRSADPAFAQVRAELETLRERLDQIPPRSLLDTYTVAELARFYTVLNLKAAMLRQLETCREAQRLLDWQQLAGRRF
jgi:hypothetical protein